MSWQVVGHMTVYREAGWYAGHPNIVRTPGGDLLALFHRSPDHRAGDDPYPYAHHAHPMFDVRSRRSTDEGRNWGPVELVIVNSRGAILDFGTHTLSDGSILLHASAGQLVPLAKRDPPPGCCDPQGNWGTESSAPFHVRSRDDGRTWSSPAHFPPIPGALNKHPATHYGVCRSGLVEMGNDRLLLPGKATADPEGWPPYFGMLQVSDDLGGTWYYGGKIADDPETHFSEPGMIRAPSGRILAVYRSTFPDLPDPWLTLVGSEDGGASWSPWRRTTIKAHPAHLLGLRDGRIFLSAGTRHAGCYGCIARVLDPEGSDIDTAEEIVVRSDSHFHDCGYPWAVELQDGSVLVVYYYVYPNGIRGIEGTIVQER